MQRLKTREDISKQVYLNRQDIRTLFQVSYTIASRIYDLAEKLDIEQLAEYRIEPTKIRITSACKVSGVTLQTLQRQASSSNQEAKKKALAEVPIALTKARK